MATTIGQDIENIEALFDALNIKVQVELQSQYDCKKINGATYADVWSKMMSQVISQSVSAIMKETEADKALKAEQLLLTRRQIQGFDDNTRQKLFDAQVNSWALMFSAGLLEAHPTFIDNDAVTRLAQEIEDSINGTSGTNLGQWTQNIVATNGASGGTSTLSWGSVSGASTYVLYANSSTGGMSGYPKTVTVNSTDTFNIPVIPNNETERFTFIISAIDAAGIKRKDSSTTITVAGPII